ncbi:hypothetical protein Pst134EA_009296 [Puccinia striiformis f. sp. tritici]|uniref:hypothetical protein n=1 Tax=Puccinia striiformis f. sp. tritici TaxID=168172 RepID=UPI002007EBFB|nr:hypothetical protein Pst134EA_009296 [Puccinia striiformis f. sp. tritici]KAH9468764.1 hypothetical protein Pst134EA_009296 [Puccinia striiformis f. sp. tritici]
MKEEPTCLRYGAYIISGGGLSLTNRKAEMLKIGTDQLWDHMNECFALHARIGLTRSAAHDYAGLKYEDFVRLLIVKMKAAWKILQNRGNFLESDRHQLISDACISELMNDGQENNIFFSYILQYASPVGNLPKIYLNSDLKLSLENSGFTWEIHGILKLLNAKTWQNLRRLHLSAQLKKFEGSTFGRLGRGFILRTSSGINGSPQSHDLDAELVKSKLLHDMITFVIQYHLQGAIATPKRLPIYPPIPAFDIAILFLSDAFKTVYHEYGEALNDDILFPAWEDEHSTHNPGQPVLSKHFIGFGDSSYRLKSLLPINCGTELLGEWPGRMIEHNLAVLAHSTPPKVILLEQKSQKIGLVIGMHRRRLVATAGKMVARELHTDDRVRRKKAPNQMQL